MKIRILSVLSGLLLCASMVEVAHAQTENQMDQSQKQSDQSKDKSAQKQKQSQQGMKEKNVISHEEVKGKVVAMDKDTLYIQGKEGIPIPVKVDDKTKIEGKAAKSHEISKKLSQDFPKSQEVRAKVAVKKDRAGHVQNMAMSIDKSSMPGQQAQPQGTMGKEEKMENMQGQVCGKAPAVYGDTLYIQGKDGLAIPVKLDQKTTLEGKKVKSRRDIEAKLRKDFKQNPEVRAKLKVETRAGKPETVAVSVEKARC